MANETYPLLALTVKAAAALTAHRFATLAGAVPAAGAGFVGVTRTAAASGEYVACDVAGVAIVEVGAAVALGALVETNNAGKAITRTSGVALGRALEAGAADGAKITVLLGAV